MCIHTEGDEVKEVKLKELCFQTQIEKLEMSLVSDCLECIRMGKGSRYVSVGISSKSLLCIHTEQVMNCVVRCRKHVNQDTGNNLL